MGTMERLKFLMYSGYIRDLATLVVAYGISINLVEVTWKSKLKAQFPSPNEYSSFMGDFSTATRIATFTMMLVSQFIFDEYGWGVAAKITPSVLLLTGVGFFSVLLLGSRTRYWKAWNDSTASCCICRCLAKLLITAYLIPAKKWPTYPCIRIPRFELFPPTLSSYL
ncbi:unnamed protein product [Trifolium pratense]|uniref:Uncharacterized protein n=1 Tax=Trifolium pratense TaxID=57577 RepID=A0ACB0KZC5_TRIPR|nr:unnamed protein product [Trifolium pratense]